MTARFRLFIPALLAVMLFGASSVVAQTPTIGYTDYELILVQMPEFRQVQAQLQERADADQQELLALQADIQQRLETKGEELENRFQSSQGPVTDEARQRMYQELQEEGFEYEAELRQELEQARQERIQGLSRLEAELMAPLYDRLQIAINAVAEQRGLSIVLSSRLASEPVLLYAGPGALDITSEVMSHLGLSMQAD